jgi:hypothetical protein
MSRFVLQHRVPGHTALVALAALGAMLAAITPGAARAADRGQEASATTRPAAWTRWLTVDLSRDDVGLSARASAPRLARAALLRQARRLGLSRSGGTLRLAGDLRLPDAGPGRALRRLRFQQTVAGLRVVWSQIDVTIAGGRVSSIGATLVPIAGRLPKQPRVSRARALRIARRAAPGAQAALAPLAAAYAGKPSTRAGRRRPARRGWVVEVQPPSAAGDDAPSPLCVVVDARTGHVIARWSGMADRPDRGADARGAHRFRAAEAQADLSQEPLEVSDATAGLPGLTYANFITAGDARINANWPSYAQARIKPASPAMDAASANASNVARTICNVRGYCGRDGGFHNRTDSFPGTVRPWIVYANHPGGNSRAHADFKIELSHLDVMGAAGDPNVPANDVIAHEFGHVMDWVYAGDRALDGNITEALAVQEALGDMFAYEYDRFDATIAEETQRARRPLRDLADPASLVEFDQPFPAHIRDYDPTPPSDHFNSTILSHAYYLLVQSLGHPKAGRVLHNVPATLSPKPTFREIARGFVARAGEIYPHDGSDAGTRSDAREAAERAFDQVGIGVRDHRGETPG